jgi:hypothetical protein
VQSPHGGHKTHGKSLLFSFSHGLLQRSDRIDDFHIASIIAMQSYNEAQETPNNRAGNGAILSFVR